MFPSQALPAPWPGYRKPPARLNITHEVLDRQATEGLGKRRALLYDGGLLTFEELKSEVDGLAWSLKALGVRRGELVLIRMANSPEFAQAFLALVKLGAIPVLVNSLLGKTDLSAILNQAEPKIVITEASRAGALRELQKNSSIERIVCAGGAEKGELSFESLLGHDGRIEEAADTAADDPAFIVYTSGTTGKPKGIVHAHRWIVALGDLNRFRLPPEDGDVVMATGEWSFISALGHNLLFPLRNGIAGAILSGRPTPENVLAAIARHKVTILYSVATVYRRLLAIPGFEREFKINSLRCANSTGEALGETTYREWKERVGCELYEHYGISEFQLVVGQGPREPVKAGSIGKPLPGVEIAIVDDNNCPVRRGELGYLVISTKDPGLFIGYHRDPERTAASRQGGWFRTGDLAYQDEDGYIFVAGRSDDCFKSRGILISPTEIENALQRHPAVVEAAVIPVPDPEIGNRIRAIVVLKKDWVPSPALAETIRESLRDHIAPFKVPHTLEFAEALPKSPVGKILRAKLTGSENRVKRSVQD